MVMSMTGYGAETFHLEDVTLTVEIRSVNSRYLDFIAKIPRSLYELELEMKKMIQSYFSRGRIELYITTTGNLLEERSLEVDWPLMDEFFSKVQQIKKRYDLSGDIPLSMITTMDELFSIKETNRSDDRLHELILNSVDKVAKQVQISRENEGNFLMKDIEHRLGLIEQQVSQIDERKEIVYAEYNKRIRERIESHLTDLSIIDEHHLIQEIALLAEKSDITEEVTRLYSHLNHFKQVVKEENRIGRKLDFIIQEIHREINTVGSKSVDSQISELAVQIKSNLEKMKEQVQNIE